MQKRIPFYVVSMFLIAAFTTAGCAKQDVVKKDEGISPTPVTRQFDPPKESTTQPVESTAATVSQTVTETVAPAVPNMMEQKTPSNEELQAALGKIYFNFDSADLSDSARRTLTKNAELIAKGSKAKILIEGNCDERGSAEYNLALGDHRAKATYQYLVTLGVEPVRLSTVSYGNEKPAVKGNNEASWAQNRRADFVVLTR
jgi:peptidoglycan-associated lipoprotein